ncbi:putative iron-sulfur cluster-binding metallochaperone [Sinimarinibacterium sp. CAU 1509]|uniref:putative iron-sulfur cluster-binding metallochaperone n=1 Tax=Sinimarinibacterium sp. CAU 1509 TaxID=2562283 RepID=UPI00269FCD38
MSDCCSASDPGIAAPKKLPCPVSGHESAQVSSSTIKHHIKAPWLWQEKAQRYYFCSDPHCDVVYFGQDGSVIDVAGVRSDVGVKNQSMTALVCYCYGVTRAEAAVNPRIREFVIAETKQHRCACEVRNPSGQCCLADFPRT